MENKTISSKTQLFVVGWVVCRVSKGRPGTNRDGTSRRPFVPGQKVSCPGVQGQEQMSWDVSGQNELKFFKKMTRFPVFGHHFPVLEHPFPVLEQCFLF